MPGNRGLCRFWTRRHAGECKRTAYAACATPRARGGEGRRKGAILLTWWPHARAPGPASLRLSSDWSLSLCVRHGGRAAASEPRCNRRPYHCDHDADDDSHYLLHTEAVVVPEAQRLRQRGDESERDPDHDERPPEVAFDPILSSLLGQRVSRGCSSSTLPRVPLFGRCRAQTARGEQAVVEVSA